MTNRKEVPENESPQERFRRVVSQRLKPIRKYSDMIKNMPIQPNYEISSKDAQHVIDELKSFIAPTIAQFEKARDGDIKAKEIKEYSGIDWDKELEPEDE